MAFTSYTVDNDRRFRNALAATKKAVGDLTIPLIEISKDFYQSEKSIFALKGAGQYPDLTAGYKLAKQKKYGFVYPILRASGALERSVTRPDDAAAINQIVNKNMLVIGTRVNYGAFHQNASKPARLRKFLFIGPEAGRYNTDQTKGRLQRWEKILFSFVTQRAQQNLGGVV